MKAKKINWFFKILFVLFLIYVGLFIAKETGYYEKTIRDKTIITDLKIKEFEKDIEDRKVIDIKKYLPEEVDYSNVFTRSANRISNKIGAIINSKADSIWEFIKTLFII